MMNKIPQLSASSLKILALFTMTVDHIGMLLFPNILILRIIGRISFPIFAYMVSEGCIHTRNRVKYLLRLLLFGAVMQIVYMLVEKDLFFNVFLTFSLSVLLCTAYDASFNRKEKPNRITGVLQFSVCVAACLFITAGLRELFDCPVSFDGGSFGFLLPVSAYIPKKKPFKLLAFVAVCCIISLEIGDIQWFSLLSVLPIVLYNGKRGRVNLKYFFYIYYPVHIAIIFAISLFI